MVFLYRMFKVFLGWSSFFFFFLGLSTIHINLEFLFFFRYKIYLFFKFEDYIWRRPEKGFYFPQYFSISLNFFCLSIVVIYWKINKLAKVVKSSVAERREYLYVKLESYFEQILSHPYWNVVGDVFSAIPAKCTFVQYFFGVGTQWYLCTIVLSFSVTY